RLLELIESWPRRVRFEGLRDWLQARQDTDTAWKEMLQATAAGPRHARRVVFEMLGVRSLPDLPHHPARRSRPPAPPEPLDVTQSLVAALHEAVPDPVIGAYAAEALRLRGVAPADTRRSAQAVLLLDRLEPLRYAEYR